MEHKTMMTSDINTHEIKTGLPALPGPPLIPTLSRPLVDPPQRDETVHLILLFYNLLRTTDSVQKALCSYSLILILSPR